jgi:hypothetical protein
MEPNSRGILKKERRTELENLCGKMVPCMKASLKTMNLKVVASLSGPPKNMKAVGLNPK